jgi:hypothetical protein
MAIQVLFNLSLKLKIENPLRQTDQLNLNGFIILEFIIIEPTYALTYNV